MSDPGELNLGLESAKSFAGKLVQAVIGFVGTIVFARQLGPVAFGGFYFLLSLVFLTDRPIRGLAVAVQKRYSEAGANRSEIVGGTALVVAGAAVLVAAGAIAAGGPLLRVTGVENAPLLFWLLFVSMAAFLPVQKMLLAEGRISTGTWNDTLRSALTFPLQLSFVLAGFGAAGMGYGLAGATLLTVPTALFVLRVRPAMPSRGTLASLWSYARFSTLTAFAGKVYDRLDVLLLGFVLTTGAVGQYEVAYKLTIPATLLSGVIASGLMSKVSGRASAGEDVTADVTNAVSYISVLSIPIFFGALALPDALVVTLYGGAYREAGVLLVGLALYQVLNSQSVAYFQTLAGLDRPDIQLTVSAVALALNVVLGLALVFPFGAVGVVVATVIAEGVRFAVGAHAVRQRLPGVGVVPRPVVEQVVAGSVMFGVVELVHWSHPVRSWVDLVGLVGLGVVVYGATLLAISSGARYTIRSVYESTSFA